MPGHSSKKQAQRTKGNARPSSSSQAAELLATSGSAATGFIGFGQSPKYVPVSSSLDDMDSSLDSDFRLVLRKLTKRDTTTKIKALQELSDLCKEKDEDSLKAMLPFWPRMYNKLALDVDHRVREATQQAMSTLVVRVRRNLAPYLRSLMGAWLLSQCDTYPTVASAASSAFSDAFPPAKQTEALGFCKESCLEYLTENLVTHTAITLSDPKTTEPEDMENKYNRVLAASLLAIRKLLSSLPANQIEGCKQLLGGLMDNGKFWKHGKSKISSVKSGMYSLLAGLCQTVPELSVQYVSKITPLVLHNLGEEDSGICPALWEAVLSLVKCVTDCWQHVNVQKAFWPQLKKVLESGCHGNAVTVAPNILPLVSQMPADMFPDINKFFDDFFGALRIGLYEGSLQKSPSELAALVRAYMEVAQLVVHKHTDSTAATSIIIDQVLPIVQASLLESNSAFYKSPLYGMMGTLVNFAESCDNPKIQQSAGQFWTSLKESIDDKLTSVEESAKEDNFEERVVFLVKCLFTPQSENKRKSGKVMFETPSDTDLVTKVSKLTVKKSLPQPEKQTLGKSCRQFVHHITLKSFEIAHRHISSNHLRIFAQLLELDPAEEVISKVIASCHGDVATETTSHYFVFHICIPWLLKVQGGQEFVEDFTHLVNVACIFLSVLDAETTLQLLNKLYESCTDPLCQYVLLKQLFSQASSVPPVADWFCSSQFGDRLVAYSRSVCEQPVSERWESDTSNILHILSLVLATKARNNDPLVPRVYIEQLLDVLERPVQNLAMESGVPNRAELAVQFVARAAQCFFSQYADCLLTSSATDLMVTLFQITLLNQCHVTADVLEEAQIAWCTGLARSIQSTGGLLNTSGVLVKLAQSVQQNVATITSLHSLERAVGVVKHLLSTVQNSLPDTADNPVYIDYCAQLMITADISVPSQVWEYLSAKGDYPCCSVPKAGHSSPTKTLFTSLYNCDLLTFLHLEVEQTGVSDWSTEHLNCLLHCVQGYAVSKLFIKQVRTTEGILGSARNQLSAGLRSILNHLSETSRHELWKIGFSRVPEGGAVVLGLKPLVTLQPEPLTLQLAPVLDSSETLTEDVVYMLKNCLPCLAPNDLLTFTEIMVARLLSLEPHTHTLIDGGLGLVSVLARLVALVTRSDESEAASLYSGAMDQLSSWREDHDDLYLYGRDIESSTASVVQFNSGVCRLMSRLVQHHSARLSDKHWDFILCSAASLVQSIEETELVASRKHSTLGFIWAVSDLVSQVDVCLKVNAGQLPPNLQTEWNEFFSTSIYSILLPAFLKYYNSMQACDLTGTQYRVLVSLCQSVSNTPGHLVLEHRLPPLLVAGESSPLPDTLQSLLNHVSPWLLATERCVQTLAYNLLHSIVDTLPDFDKEDKDKSVDLGAAGGGETRDELVRRSPPSNLVAVVDRSSSVLEALLGDLPIDSNQPISLQEGEYHYTMAYLLSWKLLLQFFKSAPQELRQEYAGFFQELSYIDRLMFIIFRLMPNKPGKTHFTSPYILNTKDMHSVGGIQHQACDVYVHVLDTMPAMVRNWWKNQDRKTSAYVDTFTNKHVSQGLCTAEIQSVQKTDVQLENMTIKARPSTREVIAVYSLEEVSIEMVVSLPANYPLGNISVGSEKRVGVTGPQWEKWLLQLNIFLQHQNGNIMDGLRLWKNNIDKRFEGVDECMICFYVLHGTNFQLPRITCRTCKKKFHSACLYKWFNTSHNATCPLCRNVF